MTRWLNRARERGSDETIEKGEEEKKTKDATNIWRVGCPENSLRYHIMLAREREKRLKP